MADCDFNQAALHQLTPSSAERARREHRHPKASTPQKSLSPLMMWTAPPRGHLSAERWSLERHQEGGRPCGNISELASTFAKNCFQVHALESEDCSATKRRLSRSGIVRFLAEVEPCAIGMEACGAAHYWARRFRAMGHEVKLTPPIYVKPYVKRGKNDAADAAAICEAMSRPNMRFVAVKSEDQQATLMAHKTRKLLIKQRTMSVNALRGHLAEFGVITAKGISHVEELVERAAAADLPAMVQATLGVLLAQLRSLDAATDELERAIVANHRRDPVSRLAATPT